jgi:hypothetical protein
MRLPAPGLAGRIARLLRCFPDEQGGNEDETGNPPGI